MLRLYFVHFDKDMTSQNPFLCNYFQVTVRKLVLNLIVPIWEHWRFYSTKVMLHIVLQEEGETIQNRVLFIDFQIYDLVYFGHATVCIL